ncbi:MAG: ABC-type multidrug transport system, ATPase component [Chthoniobacter sp.]|nr:ABC-type multidrug transport system, ATPase component [Chthoniobacter sp.]
MTLRDGLVLGRSRESDVQLPDTGVSRRHAVIERSPAGWQVRDLGSRGGTFINGRLRAVHDLVIGDVLRLGDHCFRFDGRTLEQVADRAGVELLAENVTKRSGEREILRGITLRVEASKFAGILGTSGAGKSTLLDGLSGIRLLSGGEVRIGGRSLAAFLRGSSSACGYVPQDDIVHRELTVLQAVDFASKLRLPGDVPEAERQRLVRQTIDQLGLSERAGVPIHRLSGGQRKRVSIAAEVLSRPAILFLDEPSSGLDPATEFKLMEMLRELANVGCTVVCTTHVMENVYLFDQLIILTGGRLAFSGSPDEARAHFAIEKFAALYDRIEERPPEEWEQAYTPKLIRSEAPGHVVAAPGQRSQPPFFRILLARRWAALRAEPKNLIFLLGQPVLIGALLAAMADTVSFKLFLAYLATFWFGCSNAAQEIVKELPIYRRERIVGVGRNAYLLSKLVFWGAGTLIQAVLLYVCVQFGAATISGSAEWQLASLVATGLCAVGIGLAISCLVRTPTQAVMIVPLILLPQIVLSGFVLNPFTPEGKKKAVYQFAPSHASQTIMDVSVFWREKITPQYVQEHLVAYRNLKYFEPLKTGATFQSARPANSALGRLLAWTVLSYFVSLMALAFKERAG